MPSTKTTLARGYAIALVSSVFLSTTAPFIRHLTTNYGIPALVLAFWRDLFVVVTLLPVLAIFRPTLLKLTRANLVYLLAYGLLLAVFNAIWTTSVALNGAAVSTVLAYCSAAFTALLGWWLLKERLDWVKIVAVVLCLGGCVLVADALAPTAWQTNLAGILTGVGSGLAYAIYTLMGRSAAQRGLNPWTTLFYIFGIAAAFLLIFNLLSGGMLPGAAAQASELFWLADSLAGWGVLFLLAAGPTVAGFGLYMVSLGYLPSSVVNLVATTEPVFTALIAYLFLDERLTLTQIGGALLILGGVAFLRLYEGWLANQETRSASQTAQA